MRNIREARKRCHKTLALVAEQAGISPSYLSDLECGRASNPSLKVLEKLAQCYDTTILSLQDEPSEADTQAEVERKSEARQNWYRLNMRYYATHHIVGETGLEHESIDKAIDRGLSLCAGYALCPVRLVDVTTTIIPRNSERMPFSIYVTVIAEPMIPPQKGEHESV